MVALAGVFLGCSEVIIEDDDGESGIGAGYPTGFVPQSCEEYCEAYGAITDSCGGAEACLESCLAPPPEVCAQQMPPDERCIPPECLDVTKAGWACILGDVGGERCVGENCSEYARSYAACVDALPKGSGGAGGAM